eukprot:8329880-Prorocentrum_lima.AAC.1
MAGGEPSRTRLPGRVPARAREAVAAIGNAQHPPPRDERVRTAPPGAELEEDSCAICLQPLTEEPTWAVSYTHLRAHETRRHL